MEARLFDKEKDFKTITSWFDERKIPSLRECELPQIGFIVDGVAACFLYKTDSSIANIENLISNPNSTKEDREKALPLILNKILRECLVSGYKTIYGITQAETVVNHADKLGFKDMGPYKIIRLVLK